MLRNVSRNQSASWYAFGLIIGLSTGGMENFHSIGLQGTLGPPINSSMNFGIPHQHCREFEHEFFWERTCTSWSMVLIWLSWKMLRPQFNFLVSLLSVHLLGTPAITRPLLSLSAFSTTLTNSKWFHSKNSKPWFVDDGLEFNCAFSVMHRRAENVEFEEAEEITMHGSLEVWVYWRINYLNKGNSHFLP